MKLTACRCLGLLSCLIAATAPLGALLDRSQHHTLHEELGKVRTMIIERANVSTLADHPAGSLGAQ
jgi:hypothetical protein